MEALQEKRCAVWFGEPTQQEQDQLMQSGWSVRVTSVMGEGGVGVRNDSRVVAVADLRSAEMDVIRSVDRTVAENAGVPWIALISAQTPTHEPIVKRILEASLDFFTMPIDLKRMSAALNKVTGVSVGSEQAGIDSIISAQSPAMRAIVGNLRKYAPVDLPVLITGETGTGKERAACALHSLSERRLGPFVPINCGALVPNLVQSELFGHERGAFTGANSRRIGHIESAAGGSVFLDEVGDLPLDAQTNLLRFLQEGTIERVGSSQPMHVDARVLAATHVDLEEAVAAGRFREDLYYRLNVLRVAMPALRERVEDIEPLAEHFLACFRDHHPVRARNFSSAARRAMRQFAWPGNVRELVNRVQRAAVVAEDALISVSDLDLDDEASLVPSRGLGHARVAAERDAIIQCLRDSRFNISECARRLRISRVTVYRLCKKHRLVLDEMR